jgi:hypothetical protein
MECRRFWWRQRVRFGCRSGEGSSLTKLEAAFDRVWHAGTDLAEAREADGALAAADIVAACTVHLGSCNSYTEGIDTWARSVRRSPPDDLVNKARRAVDRITSKPSELLDLRSASGEVATVEGLRQRPS